MNERIRKAWRVYVKDYDDPGIVYAPTAGKARVQIWRSLDDGVTRIIDVTARRAPECDVRLPPRSPIADQLSKDQLHCLLHAFGGNGDVANAGKRDYFYTRHDDPPLLALCERGLMRVTADEAYGPGMAYFTLTQAGNDVALSCVPEYN